MGIFQNGYIDGQWVGMNPGMNTGNMQPVHQGGGNFSVGGSSGGSSGLSPNSGVPGAYGLYNTAVEQQAGDYSSIMQQYKNLANGPAMANLGELASTGGYSEGDKANLRERGLGPIRSIYSSANRDVDRQKAIQGGYSPNYGAVKAKMARDLSTSIGDQVTKVNAGIADSVANNRVGLAGTYANAQLQPVQGQQSLYGTTPALASTFGNQALQSAQLQQNINQAPANYGGGIAAGSGNGYYRATASLGH